VETLTPIGRASLPFAVAELETLGLDPRNVSFGLRNGKRHVVPAVRPLLIVPGEPLARAALDALASARYERSMPDLPSAIRPGAVVGTHTLASVREQEDGYEVVLTSLGVHARLRIRPNDRTRPATLRTSAWDVEIDRPESLGEETRTAIRALVAALLVSARANPTSSKRPSRVR
jgi:hypothetical protein